MKRPSEIWWCRYDEADDEEVKMIEDPNCCSKKNGDTELCKIDDLPCDAVRGIILWEKKCSE